MMTLFLFRPMGTGGCCGLAEGKAMAQCKHFSSSCCELVDLVKRQCFRRGRTLSSTRSVPARGAVRARWLRLPPLLHLWTLPTRWWKCRHFSSSFLNTALLIWVLPFPCAVCFLFFHLSHKGMGQNVNPLSLSKYIEANQSLNICACNKMVLYL